MRWSLAGAALGAAVAVTRRIVRRRSGTDDPPRRLAVPVTAEPDAVRADFDPAAGK